MVTESYYGPVNNDTERHILMSNFPIFYFFHKETKLDMDIVVMMLVEGPHQHITFVYNHY